MKLLHPRRISFINSWEGERAGLLSDAQVRILLCLRKVKDLPKRVIGHFLCGKKKRRILIVDKTKTDRICPVMSPVRDSEHNPNVPKIEVEGCVKFLAPPSAAWEFPGEKIALGPLPAPLQGLARG